MKRNGGETGDKKDNIMLLRADFSMAHGIKNR